MVRSQHPEKAPQLMLVTELGIIVLLHPTRRVFDSVSMIALQFSRESYVVLPSSTTIEIRLQQSEKTSACMEVTF